MARDQTKLAAKMVEKSEMGFENMKVQLGKLDQQKRTDRVSVKEQSQRINQILIVKRRRYENL